MAGKRKKSSFKGKGGYLSYRAENRRLKHKANKLTKRIKHYKTFNILKGIKNTNKELYLLIKKKLEMKGLTVGV